jgi:hypothetical protein
MVYNNHTLRLVEPQFIYLKVNTPLIQVVVGQPTHSVKVTGDTSRLHQHPELHQQTVRLLQVKVLAQVVDS